MGQGGFYLQCGEAGETKGFSLQVNGGGASFAQDPEQVLGGSLHHVAVAVGPGGARLYIDGECKCENASGRLDEWVGNLELVSTVRSASADEIRLQPSVASAAWIKNDYLMQNDAGYCACTLVKNPTNLYGLIVIIK